MEVAMSRGSVSYSDVMNFELDNLIPKTLLKTS